MYFLQSMSAKTKPKQQVLVALYGQPTRTQLDAIKSKLRPLEELGYHVVLDTQAEAILAAARKIRSSGQSAARAYGYAEASFQPEPHAVAEAMLADPLELKMEHFEYRIERLETLLAAMRGEKSPSGTADRTSAASTSWDPYEEGKKEVQQLKEAEGGGLDRNQAADRLSISIPALHSRRKQGRIVAWPDGGAHRFKFPRWQFGANGMLPGVEDCLQALRGSDEWAIMRFFLFPSESIGGKRPLDLLREGRIDEAVELAKSQSIDF